MPSWVALFVKYNLKSGICEVSPDIAPVRQSKMIIAYMFIIKDSATTIFSDFPCVTKKLFRIFVSFLTDFKFCELN